MKSGTRKTNTDPPLSTEDIEGAVRVFQSLEKLVARPRLVDSLHPKASETILLAKRIHAFRQKRNAFFEPEIFGEPAWDILLSLYMAAIEGYRMKVSAVCNESGVPCTTALRWVETLRELGLITKRRNPLDARSSFLELTPKGLDRMERFLQFAWQQYFPFD
jgi:DNA-binding MarR family transcriptional regulator